MFRPKDFAELTTPAAPNRKGTFSSWCVHPSSARRGMLPVILLLSRDFQTESVPRLGGPLLGRRKAHSQSAVERRLNCRYIVTRFDPHKPGAGVELWRKQQFQRSRALAGPRGVTSGGLNLWPSGWVYPASSSTQHGR